MNYKTVVAEKTTITRDLRKLEQDGNIFEILNIISKRSNQISQGMKDELIAKLAEFATHTDNLEEIFENREQIEVSRFYERLPKPVAIAVEEYLNGKTYIRRTDEEEN